MKGFTMIEMVLVIATIAVLAGISVPAYSFLQIKNDLDMAVNATTQTLRRAQVLSQAVDGDSTWGVKIQSSDITLFKGASYSARDTNFDESYTLNNNVIPTGVTEVVFSKLFGIPNTSGTLTFTSSNNDVQNITLNSKGFLDY